MTDVQPRLKPDPAICPCGCGVIGRPRTRAWRGEAEPHTRNCTCRRCSAGAHGKNERKRVGRFARATGLTRAPMSGAVIGYDLGGIVAVEETANEAVVKGLRKWWAGVGVQRKVRRIREQQLQPWAFVASWDGKPRLVVMDPEGFAALCQAANGPDFGRDT